MKNLQLISAIQQAQVSDEWRSITITSELSDLELHQLGVKIADMMGYVPISHEIRWSVLIKCTIQEKCPEAFLRGNLCRQIASYIDSHESYFITKAQSRDLWTNFFSHRHEDIPHCPVAWKRELTLDSDFDRFIKHASTFPEIDSLDEVLLGNDLGEDSVLLLYRFVCHMLRWPELKHKNTMAQLDWALYFSLGKWLDQTSSTITYRDYAIKFLEIFMQNYAR